jgi:nucleoside triphosphatase
MATIQKFPKGVEIVGGVIMENSEGKIFMAKSPKWSNKWTFPGGHIEPGEKIEDALVREAKEETGIQNIQPVGIVSFGELINSKDFHRPAHFIYFDVYCKIDSPEIKLDNNELTEYGWFSPEEALKLDLAESFDKSINDYLKFKENHS